MTGPARPSWPRRPSRTALAVAGLVTLAVLAGALVLRGGSTGRLDPEGVDRGGSRALARVLAGQGVQVVRAETTDAAMEAVRASGGQATVLITAPHLLGTSQLRRVQAAVADLVLLAPDATALDVLAPTVTEASAGPTEELAPACELPVARRAGTAALGAVRYTATDDPAAVTCYPAEDGHGLVVTEPAEGTGTVTVVGDATPFTNENVDQAGNAALALGLLGARPTLVWYLPSPTDVPPEERRSLPALLPPGALAGAAQVLVAVVLLAGWRARRLGPVVTEPLPVVVRATETVEGRARLYRRARARGPAAAALRAASLRRLTGALGQASSDTPQAVVAALAERTGRPATEISDLLYGGSPLDDAGLVRLADALDRLEREARRP